MERVGINTASPQHSLHVVGGGIITGTLAVNALAITEDDLVSNLNADFLDGRHGWQYRESDNFVSGISGYYLDNVTGAAEFQNVTIRGQIESVVYSNKTVSAISGQVILSQGATLSANVLPGDAFIEVNAPSFGVDDIIQIKATGGRNEWMRIVSNYTLTGTGFQYTVARNLNELYAPESFYIGETIVGRGAASFNRETQPLASGEVEGAYGSYQPGGSGSNTGGGWIVFDGEIPYIGVEARYGPLWNQYDRVAQIGNLQGSPLEYAEETWGFFIGDANSYFVYDKIDGMRLYNSGLDAYESTIGKSGVISEMFTITAIGTPPDYDNSAAKLFMTIESDIPKLWVKMKGNTPEFTEVTQRVGSLLWEDLDTDDDGAVDSANAVKIRGITIKDSVPEAGQVMKYIASTDQWESTTQTGFSNLAINPDEYNEVITVEANNRGFFVGPITFGLSGGLVVEENARVVIL